MLLRLCCVSFRAIDIAIHSTSTDAEMIRPAAATTTATAIPSACPPFSSSSSPSPSSCWPANLNLNLDVPKSPLKQLHQSRNSSPNPNPNPPSGPISSSITSSGGSMGTGTRRIVVNKRGGQTDKDLVPIPPVRQIPSSKASLHSFFGRKTDK